MPSSYYLTTTGPASIAEAISLEPLGEAIVRNILPTLYRYTIISLLSWLLLSMLRVNLL
jgi:hypothetical protein